MAILPLLLTAAIVLSTALAIQAEHRGARGRVYVFKPLATLLILLLAGTAQAPVSARYQALVCAGLLFSLAGDVFLMLPRDRFVAGLASFLVAHGLYIAAFAPWPPALRVPAVLVVLLLFAAGLLRTLWKDLGTLRLPVVVYAAALVGMAWQAAERWAALGTPSAGLAVTGALLFVVSDATLAWERFAGRFRYGSVVVLATYFAAQWLIAMSVARPFG